MDQYESYDAPQGDDLILQQGEEFQHVLQPTQFLEGPLQVDKGTIKINCIKGINLGKKNKFS
jgi:hypothetical protein